MSQKEDEAEGPGIMVVSLKGEARPARPAARARTGEGPAVSPDPFSQAGVSPSPFGSPGASPAPFGNPNVSPSPFGAPPPQAAPEVPSLDLDDRRAEPPPPSTQQKKLRPELEQWSQTLTTGEHPALVPDVSAPASRGFPVLPVVGGLLLVAGLGAGGFFLLGKERAPKERKPRVEVEVTPGFVPRPENAPDCFTTNEGFQFSYRAANGETVTVSRLEEIPVLYRVTARCIRR